MENSTVDPGGGSCARWFLGTGRGGGGLLQTRLAGASRFLGTHFPSGMSLVKYNLFPKLCPTTCAKTGSPAERMNITFVPRRNMAVLSSSIQRK